MAELFQTSPQNITLHLKALYAEGEITPEATCKSYLQVRSEGSHQFPMRQFKMTKTANVKSGRWNDAEALDFETECVRAAVTGMMNTDPAKAYRAHPQ